MDLCVLLQNMEVSLSTMLQGKCPLKGRVSSLKQDNVENSIKSKHLHVISNMYSSNENVQGPSCCQKFSLIFVEQMHENIWWKFLFLSKGVTRPDIGPFIPSYILCLSLSKI